MCTPYERRDDWIMEVVRWRGTLYLVQVDTEKRRREKLQETPRQRQMSSWGYKFEQLMTSPEPGVSPDTEVPVDENEEFCCLFRTRINGTSIVYGAEMDAYKADKRLQEGEALHPDNFVEMKTSRIIEHERQDRNFRLEIIYATRSFISSFSGDSNFLNGGRNPSLSELESCCVAGGMMTEWSPPSRLSL